ncbi:2,3-bisphosphoglycerate-dependent phosphoglycerate mutase [Calothrix sp. CCY 0018]|uniref:2,3-bisphosphoglycerate-dependent phosphoglycerate mutase n=1 Tax=Calothrix sp. CCY 0018 TaxID=3103864 RepID=UPI0039C65803
MTKLILIRHGQSTWNAANRFSGWVDVPLNRRGRIEATLAADKLKDYQVDVCFTSLLVRAMETAVICLTENEQICNGKSPVIKHNSDELQWHGWDQYEGKAFEELPIFTSMALDERFYGDLQGLKKAETAEKLGKELVHQWRRSFSVRPPGGESLSDTMNRTLPFFKERIITHLKQGDTTLIAAHGNSLRSIIMELDKLEPEEVPNLELATGQPIVYDVDEQGNVSNKLILN